MSKHRSFTLDKFINSVNDDLLKEYFQQRKLDYPTDQACDSEQVEKFLSSLCNDGLSKEIEEELHFINDIADKSRDYLEIAIKQYDIPVEENETSESTAMRVFLHSEEAFSLAYDHYLYVLYSEKLTHHKFENVKAEFNEITISAFKQKVKDYFRESGKSENCDIRAYTEDKKYYFIIARGDFMRTHLVFEDSKVKIASYRPAQEDMIVFNERNLVLSLQVKGRADDDRKKYIELFGTTFLGLDKIDEDTFNNTLLVLEPIKNGSFNYGGNEYIEKVVLSEVKVKQRGAGPIRLIVGAQDVTRLFSRYGLQYDSCEYVSVKLKFFIKREGKKSKALTVEIQPPGKTSLKERDGKKVVEDYLRENEILLV